MREHPRIMDTAVEIIEIAFVLLPIVLALFFALKKPTQIRTWVAWVIGASANAIVALGLLLKRLTSTCLDTPPACAPSQILVYRIPGIVSTCSECRTPPASSIASYLNSLALPLQATTAIICVMTSFYVTARFIIWAKRVLTPSSSNTHVGSSH